MLRILWTWYPKLGQRRVSRVNFSRLIACCHIRDEEEEDDDNNKEDEEEEEDNDDEEEEAGRPGWKDEDNGSTATMSSGPSLIRH